MTQSPNRNQLVLIAITLLIAIALVLITWLSPLPFLIWNASKSVPIGWYYVEHRQPKLHEIAVINLRAGRNFTQQSEAIYLKMFGC